MALRFRGALVRLNWVRVVGVVLALATLVAGLARLATPTPADAPAAAPDEGALRQSLGHPPHPR